MKILYRIITIYICFIPIKLFTQTLEDNLQKYWNYRYRLRENFIVVSPNNEKGTNIPAAYITGNEFSILHWGDGNGCIQYYIGLLATEYKLLQLNKLDYSETRNELLYALKAVERLDKTAEKYFRNPSISKEDDLNGFFIRDDVDDSIKLMKKSWKNCTIHSTYTDYMKRNGAPYEQSKDNVWHYLPNLALVVQLVDDDEIKNYAIDIATRMIENMHHTRGKRAKGFGKFILKIIPDKCLQVWRIKNPVTNKDVEDGATVEEIGKGIFNIDGFNYGFAEAGYWITKKDLHFGRSFSRHFWFMAAIRIAPRIGIDSYSYRSLATTAGFPKIGKTPTRDFLIDCAYRDTTHPYEHFPLIYSILHIDNDDNYIFQKEFDKYKKLLDEAPIYGNYNFGKEKKYQNMPIRPDNWSIDNRLVWPEKINRDLFIGYYNGIDYMLLHNLFWLAYITPQNQKIENEFDNVNNKKYENLYPHYQKLEPNTHVFIEFPFGDRDKNLD